MRRPAGELRAAGGFHPRARRRQALPDCGCHTSGTTRCPCSPRLRSARRPPRRVEAPSASGVTARRSCAHADGAASPPSGAGPRAGCHQPLIRRLCSIGAGGCSCIDRPVSRRRPHPVPGASAASRSNLSRSAVPRCGLDRHSGDARCPTRSGLRQSPGLASNDEAIAASRSSPTSSPVRSRIVAKEATESRRAATIEVAASRASSRSRAIASPCSALRDSGAP